MNYYDVFPLTVPSGRVSEVRVVPKFAHAAFAEGSVAEVWCIPVEGELDDGMWQSAFRSGQKLAAPEWSVCRGALSVKFHFVGEQEYMIQVKKSDGSVRSFRIYALHDDLLAFQPFKGDFHIHTTGSDGREAPCYVAARYRQAGFDFAAISDHRAYEPSLEAIARWKESDLDFKLYPGEEVHSPDNGVHIINFGSRFSVNSLWRADEACYRQEVAEYLERLPDYPGVNRFEIAASEWVFDKIRAGGGLAVFCHPYWYTTWNVISEGTASAMFDRRKFDAFELFGGFYRFQSRSNNYQVARWIEERARGNDFPVVGLSDSHGTDGFELSGTREEKKFGAVSPESSDADLFGWYYTIVFAESNGIDPLTRAIRDSRCVAVSHPSGERPEVCGSFRLVKYADFLIRNFFPVQKLFCATEGALMLDALAGEQCAAEALSLLKHRSSAYRRRCFASNSSSNR